jgi:hypothetical protein
MMIVIAAVKDERQPLAFGGPRCQLWQRQWQLSTAAIAVVISVNNRMMGGTDKFGWRTTQQARSDRRHNNQPSTRVLEVQ